MKKYSEQTEKKKKQAAYREEEAEVNETAAKTPEETEAAGVKAAEPEKAAVKAPSGERGGGIGRNILGISGGAASREPEETEDVYPAQEKIGVEQLRKFDEILRKYKTGKANLERRIIEAEQWWKLQHWEQIRRKDTSDPEPTSGWLVNVILSKHSDAMDGYPAPVILPREESDAAEARTLTSIIPVILQQNRFRQTYSDAWWYKLKGGTAVYGVFWDSAALGGLGDIAIRKIDILNLFWEPGITDIQKSRYLFHVELLDNEILEARYPELRGKLGARDEIISRYIYDDAVDTSDKSMVVDVYYKVTGDTGRQVLHYVKYCGETVLYATENDLRPAGAEPPSVRGLYDSGLYPFVFDALFPEEGTPAGYGYVDLCKSPQRSIDLINNAILKNTIAAATPRWFIRNDGGVNEGEYADMTKPFIHTNGNLGSDSIMPVQANQLGNVYLNTLQLKISELKETSGNRDVNTGGTASGVTAASAIAALQEAGNGLSRDMLGSCYRAFENIVYMCIELIRQFYDLPRQFRIVGESGGEQFLTYTNAGLRPGSQGTEFGLDMGPRLPVFDLEVCSQKEDAYTTLANNELALQFFQLGFFNPQMAEEALCVLDMMEFKQKEKIVRKIAANAQTAQKLSMYMQLALALAQKYEPETAQRIAADMTGQSGSQPAAVQPVSGGEHPFVSRARQTAVGGLS